MSVDKMTGSKKRILFLVGATRVFGAEIAMLTVMRGLKKRGYEIHCITSGWSDGDFESRLKEEGIPFTSLKLGFLYLRRPLWTLDTLIHYPGALLGFYRVKRRFRPDFVYHLSPRTVIMLFPLISKRNTIHHLGDVVPGTTLNRFLYSIVRRKVSFYVAVSNEVRDNLISLGIPEDRIAVVWNGVPEPSGVEPWREGKSEGRFTLAIVGQIIPRKGHLVLIEALRVVREKRDDLVCRIIGAGDVRYIGEVKEAIRRYGLEGNIEWSGYIRDQDRLYEGVDLLVVPSYEEPFGLVAAEAAIRGIPVIASRVGGLPEIINDGVTGFLFEVGNHGELAEKILLLMEDEALRQRMGEAARKWARERFTEEAMCDRIERVLDLVGREL
jgi:glycosyltransferase involved in cell wall biosynthesis